MFKATSRKIKSWFLIKVLNFFGSLILLLNILGLCKAETQPHYLTNYLNISDNLHLKNGLFRHNYNLSEAVNYAKSRMGDRRNNVANSLGAIIILSSGFKTNDHTRMKLLRCSLRMMTLHINANTPLEIYLWVPASHIPYKPQWLNEQYPNVIIMPLKRDLFKIPETISENTTWVRRHQFDFDYYVMGRWRLTYSFDFIRAMGHKYLLQIDDDTFVNQKINFNIIQNFTNSKICVGVWRNIETDPEDVLRGLPEFTRLWMKMRNMIQPNGALLEHLDPPNMSGLTSDGWDKKYYRGAFNIFSIDFWFDRSVQDYLNLLFKTGSDIEQRWQDQGVQNMIRLLFAPKQSVYVFNDIDIVHGKPNDRILRSWGC